MTVVDDGTLTLALLPLQLPSASFFNTSVVSNLSIVTQWPSLLPPGYGSYQTNSVTLTFAPLAGPPLITQWYADIQDTSIPQLQYPPRGCVIDNPAARLSNYSGCYPSVVEVYSIAVTSVYVFGTNQFGGSLSILSVDTGQRGVSARPDSEQRHIPVLLALLAASHRWQPAGHAVRHRGTDADGQYDTPICLLVYYSAHRRICGQLLQRRSRRLVVTDSHRLPSQRRHYSARYEFPA